MIVNELIKYLEDWAPPGASWEKDNVGLLVGSGEDSIKNIFLTLELNEEVLDEALKKKCNFIFTHHPIIFNPIKKLNFHNDTQAKLISRLIKNDISLFSAHTNLDFTKDGVSFELAKKLKLEKIRFLKNQNNNQYKIVVFVPQNKLDDVANSMFDNGAGIIGEYNNCSFRLTGEGTFQGSSNSNPFIGKKENFEKVNEVRIEVIVDSWNLNKVINSMLNAHPYEEPAYDIYPLKNKNTNYGAGAIGDLKKELNVDEFLIYIKKNLSIPNFRYSLGNKNKIKKVAVCGGAGSDLLQDAIQNNADAFITSDVKYHSFHDALNKILFVDAGHYETEIVVLNIVEKRIQSFINNKKEKIKIYKFSKTTNPIKFYKQ